MPDIYVIRAEFGTYSKHFLDGCYVGIGWLIGYDLSKVTTREEVKRLYEKDNPKDTSVYVIGQQVGQIYRFLFDMKSGDYIITPDSNTEYIHWGTLKNEPYYYDDGKDGCPYNHRRKVKWEGQIERSQFSVPFQNSIRSSLTVFSVVHKNDFFETIGKNQYVERDQVQTHKRVNEAVLERILQLTAEEFEILVTNLLTALGFESKHTGKVGDGGVDATGELNLYGIAKINLYVQVKRYNLGSKVNAGAVKLLRSSIPAGAQGAFFTTSDFQDSALKVAIEPGFPRIGTINGEQLVDLLSEKWQDLQLPEELKNKLGLKRGLVLE
jgi:predicted Mrr-cat superfamily restriction endonuclease